MGMATPIPTKSSSIAGNLVICKLCGAQYDPDREWVKGEYIGTSMQFTPLMVIPEDCCPVCLKRNEKNPGENNGAM